MHIVAQPRSKAAAEQPRGRYCLHLRPPIPACACSMQHHLERPKSRFVSLRSRCQTTKGPNGRRTRTLVYYTTRTERTQGRDRRTLRSTSMWPPSQPSLFLPPSTSTRKRAKVSEQDGKAGETWMSQKHARCRTKQSARRNKQRQTEHGPRLAKSQLDGLTFTWTGGARPAKRLMTTLLRLTGSLGEAF